MLWRYRAVNAMEESTRRVWRRDTVVHLLLFSSALKAVDSLGLD